MGFRGTTRFLMPMLHCDKERLPEAAQGSVKENSR
jgi:hypothetical protein